MFKPNFKITSEIMNALLELEALRSEINHLPINPSLMRSLRESALFSAVHYSTMIEGNRLTQEQVIEVVKEEKRLEDRKRDEAEVLGYYAALDEMFILLKQKTSVSQEVIKKIHAWVMGGGAKKIKPTPYRTVQNAIYEGGSRRLVYLPPEEKDVPELMEDLVVWINNNPDNLACPLIAALAHYQFATIHPYIDGNGRTARLLATYILHLCDYDLKGIYSLDEYYAKNLAAYYQALSIGPSHNYYMGREKADITPWIEYFCFGMVESFKGVKELVLKELKKSSRTVPHKLRELDARQRLALTLFEKQNVITSADIAALLKIGDRSARGICQQWVKDHFLVVESPAKKSRKYRLAPDLIALVEGT